MKSIFKSKVMMVVICLVSVITLLMIPNLVLAVDTADSARSNIQPRWSFLHACDSSIDYASDISPGLLIVASTETYDDCYAGVEVQLQRYTTSGIWMDVPTYSWSDYQEDTFAEVSEDNVSVSRGVYRCTLIHTAYATNGMALESEAFYSDEITVR